MKCMICGKEIEHCAYGDQLPLCSSECFSDYFWLEHYKEKDLVLVRDDFNAFKIGSEESYEKGFDGREFKIRLINTNEMIVTHNLWHLGEIPEKFRDKYKVNCEFVK